MIVPAEFVEGYGLQVGTDFSRHIKGINGNGLY
jgi:hypothetical protein